MAEVNGVIPGSGRNWELRRPAGLNTRLIMPLGIPMALGLALGMVLALSGGPARTRVEGAAATARASQDAAQVPVSSTSLSCEIVVPRYPLSAAGLATPWQLTGQGGESPAVSGCQRSNPDLQVSVQATILNPATGALSVYEPLVITAGSSPAVAPALTRLPADAVVSITVGFTGGSLRLGGAAAGTLAQARCVDGLGGSRFGQVSFCNSAAFYVAADSAKLLIPANGTSPLTGQPCPTIRSFDLAGQDPADSRLLDEFVLPALDCTPFTAPDLSADGKPGTSQVLDELSAARNQHAPIALAPENDPMTMVNGAYSKQKTDLYRAGLGQPLVESSQRADTPAGFCASMLNVASAFIAANEGRFAAFASPVPAIGDNLFTFLASQLSASYARLGCKSFGLTDTVKLTVNGSGTVTGAVLGLTRQAPHGRIPSPQPAEHPAHPARPAPDPTPSPGPSGSSPESSAAPEPSPSPAGEPWSTQPNPGGPLQN